jgi:hypothetical protein
MHRHFNNTKMASLNNSNNSANTNNNNNNIINNSTSSIANNSNSITNNNPNASSRTTLKDRVTLIVDETPFVVDSKLFNAHQNTLLGRMFSNKNFEMKANARGEYDIGRGTCLTSAVFRLILVSINFLNSQNFFQYF